MRRSRFTSRSSATSAESVTRQLLRLDGHGSVRELTAASGNVTDTHDYEAFGNLLHGSTPSPLHSWCPESKSYVRVRCPIFVQNVTTRR
jgi:hypothetical protein